MSIGGQFGLTNPVNVYPTHPHSLLPTVLT